MQVGGDQLRTSRAVRQNSCCRCGAGGAQALWHIAADRTPKFLFGRMGRRRLEGRELLLAGSRCRWLEIGGLLIDAGRVTEAAQRDCDCPRCNRRRFRSERSMPAPRLQIPHDASYAPLKHLWHTSSGIQSIPEFLAWNTKGPGCSTAKDQSCQRTTLNQAHDALGSITEARGEAMRRQNPCRWLVRATLRVPDSGRLGRARLGVWRLTAAPSE